MLTFEQLPAAAAGFGGGINDWDGRDLRDKELR